MNLPSRKRFLGFALLPAACLLAACGANDTGASSSTTSALASSALLGQWDIVGSDSDGTTRPGTIDLSTTALTVSFGDYVLRFNDSPSGATAVYEDHSQRAGVTTAIPTVHAALPVASGIIPLALGGDWVLTDPNRPGAGCTAHFAGDGFASQCANVKIQPDWADFDASHPYPYAAWNSYSGWGPLPPALVAWEDAAAQFFRRAELPSANGDLTGVRVRTLASSFGELGGEWEFTGSGGVICNATLSGATFKTTCAGIQGTSSEADANGTLAVTFATGMASGTTSKGVEFLGRRVHG